ncbi:cupin domain-containing protein [Nocardiopsis kunsanensis]|uniref:cupin domain-containing protein n=1 Tax=Nocardiopsis kunsanensis TaxID=141693 RepID=UPI000363A00F|nr:cupin domain-containing protein [Nocardiopsis kunsanensis]
MTHVLHLTELERWSSDGDTIEADSLYSQGFMHASPDETTLLAVANTLYTEASEPMVVLVVDTAAVGSDVRWEAADPAPPPGVGPEMLFPHIYGPIPREAVVGVRFLRRDPWNWYAAVEKRPATAELLDLWPHPEGGWYRQTWRTDEQLRPDGSSGARSTATGIQFLLPPEETSRWHRVSSDEMWVFNRGGPMLLEFGGTGETPEYKGDVVLGPEVERGESLQVLVPAGTWQAAHPLSEEETLVSCFVSPGFDFADFEAR